MSIHSYPLLLSLYKGEGRILIIPIIDHVAGYSINADWYLNITDVDDATKIGTSVISAADYIRNSPLSSLTPKEREDNAAWKKNTKYKNKVTFWKNNHYVRIKVAEDNSYIIHSMQKSEKRQGAYADIIDEVVLSAGTNAEEIGKAVISTFYSSELFYKKYRTESKDINKEIQLLDVANMNKKIFSVSVYKGENRYYIVPLIKHIGGYSIESEWFKSLPISTELNALGNCVGEAIQHIKNSPMSTLTLNEIKTNATWKKNSKYKSWLSFWKNNLLVNVNFDEYEGFTIYSTKRTVDIKGGYYDCIKKILLSQNATSEEIGRTIIDVFDAADKYYLENTDKCKIKQIKLLNEQVLTINNLNDVQFYDMQDASAAEVYQCYSYIPKENADSSAEIFLGIAPELDCDIAHSNIQSVWENIYEKADFFEVRDIDYGIFKLRVEMKNKNTHKISYLLKMEEDLLLECGLDVHQPNRRKKLDDKLVQIFESFAFDCKLS